MNPPPNPSETLSDPVRDRRPAAPIATAAAAPRVWSSEALLGPHGEIAIEHRGRRYRLRLTRQDRLILTA